MTIEEVTNLRKQEKNRTLRKPECMIDPKSVVENSLEKIIKKSLKKGLTKIYFFARILSLIEWADV